MPSWQAHLLLPLLFQFPHIVAGPLNNEQHHCTARVAVWGSLKLLAGSSTGASQTALACRLSMEAEQEGTRAGTPPGGTMARRNWTTCQSHLRPGRQAGKRVAKQMSNKVLMF